MSATSSEGQPATPPASPRSPDGPPARAVAKDHSWLLASVRVLLTLWRYELSVWAWAPLFHGNRPASRDRRIAIFDAIWLGTCVGSAAVWFGNWWAWQKQAVTLLRPEQAIDVPAWQLWGMAIAIWRLVDIFLNALDVTPVGPGAVRPRIRTPALNQRLVLLNLLTLVEVIFLNASVSFFLEQWGLARYDKALASPVSEGLPALGGDALVHALQTSLSTITTVGYGTYAPANLCAVALSFLETFTGLLLITLVAAGALSLTVSPPATNHEHPHQAGEELSPGDRTGGGRATNPPGSGPKVASGGTAVGLVEGRHWLVPLVATAGMLGGLWVLLKAWIQHG